MASSESCREVIHQHSITGGQSIYMFAHITAHRLSVSSGSGGFHEVDGLLWSIIIGPDFLPAVNPVFTLRISDFWYNVGRFINLLAFIAQIYVFFTYIGKCTGEKVLTIPCLVFSLLALSPFLHYTSFFLFFKLVFVVWKLNKQLHRSSDFSGLMEIT